MAFKRSSPLPILNFTSMKKTAMEPSDTTLDDGFRQVPKCKAKYSNKAVEDLRVKV
jgi:hypothetical protein